MNLLPFTSHPILLRTYFSDDTKWESLCKKATELVNDEFQAELECINNKDYEGVENDQIVENAFQGPHPIIFVADQITIENTDNLIMCIDLKNEPSRYFRVIPTEMWNVENNLSDGNMDFDEFLSATGQDGVFRGF